MRTFLVVILILTALLLACTSEPAPPPQAGAAAGAGNYSAGHTTTHRDAYGTASACPDGYARTGDCGDPRADPDNGTNCHANATDGDCATRGNTYRRAA